ncbi:MAG: LysM peptidoglycan-binding domain-containing protein [Spirochaetia bacterium]|nr:LysM peptidoglycan-binding domain-containing protein [Spirochaetia bacterium]
MDGNKRNAYDDMSPGAFGKDYSDKKFIFMKRLVSIVIFLFIAASIAGIVFLLADPEKSVSSQAPGLKTELSSSDNLDTGLMSGKVVLPEADVLLDVEAEAVIEGHLSDEQKAAAAIASEAADADSTDVPEQEAAADTSPAEVPVNGAADSPALPVESAESSTDAENRDGAEADSDTVVYRDYTVKQGDTLNQIASRFGIQPRTLISVNGIRDVNQISTGMRLKIPDRDGLIYTVKSGDSLSLIAYSFGMGYIPLAEVNGLTSDLIRPGDKLFVPGRLISEEDYRMVMKTLFIKPSEGQIQVHYGDEKEDLITGELFVSKGISIISSTGTPVLAAMEGVITTVITNLATGLGKHVLIEHENGYQTLYAHLDTVSEGITPGSRIPQGAAIGTLGRTGSVIEPQLYFELRKDSIPVDPEQYF